VHATCHALSGLFCADRAPDTDPPREERLRACASQQTVAAESSRHDGTKNSRKRSAKGAAAAEEEDGGFTLESTVGALCGLLGRQLLLATTGLAYQMPCGFASQRVANKSNSAQFANQWCAVTKILIRLMLWPKAQRCSMAYTTLIQLAHISRLKASPAGLFNCDCGMFLVRLRIECATRTDYHYVAYNAQTGRVLDNAYERYAKVPRVEATYKGNNKRATKVCFQLFSKANEIWVDAVSVAQINSTYE